ncbi:MAG: 6-phosphogluconolactonase [Bacteroidetes bacterium]|nr:MAG: 6-phosphogluconolactonase [Bacteroidota bacterium]
MQLITTKNIDELNWQVAEWMTGYINEVLKEQERFTIVLSGGSTPKKLYRLLASDEFKEKIDWEKLHIFWGDERYVPITDDRNNAKMAFDTLLRHVPVPKLQIHVMRTDIGPEESASEYEKLLEKYFPEAASFELRASSKQSSHDSRPDSHRDTTHDSNHGSQLTARSFDLVLLGLGDNAHTLSLFPGEEIIHEKNRWVKSVFVKEVNMQRITLTAPVVNLSKRIAFLVSGQDKADAVSHVLLNEYTPDLYPAQVIKPKNGDLFWFLDEAAAMRLKK